MADDGVNFCTGFKKSFKKFKQKISLNAEDFIDFSDNNCLKQGRIKNINTNVADIFGVAPASNWKAYSINHRPGLIFVRNPFTTIGQRYWTVRCLKNFTRKPNKRNVDIDKDLGEIDDIWEFFQNHDFKSLDKLRWATLGYHHNWETKVYSEDYKSVFPEDLAQLGNHFASALGYPTYDAQSAIVNFYHPSSTLSGHVDNSEVDLNAPLLSFSFGQSAIFLIGGPTIEEEGIPLILQSGDVLLMSREARLCYHAIPRIIPAKTSPWSEEQINEFKFSDVDEELLKSLKSDTFWYPFERYISRSRINMNIRQVLPAGQTSLYQSVAN